MEGEDYDDYLFQYTRHISTWVNISSATSTSWSSTSDKWKDWLNKERMKRNLKTLRHTRKRPLHADRRRQLGGEPPVHSRSVVKICYNIKMTTQKIRSHDDRRSTTWICSSSPTMIYSSVQIYMKPSQYSRLKYIWNQSLHYPWWSLERRGKAQVHSH